MGDNAEVVGQYGNGVDIDDGHLAASGVDVVFGQPAALCIGDIAHVAPRPLATGLFPPLNVDAEERNAVLFALLEQNFAQNIACGEAADRAR